MTNIDSPIMLWLSHVSVTPRILIVMIAAAAAALIYVSAAAASCNPGRTPNHETYGIAVGWDASPPSGTCLDGSLASMQVKTPYFYADKTLVFTALYNSTNATHAWVGWQQTSSGLQTFSETNVVSTGYFAHDTYGSVSSGTDPAYKVTFGSGDIKYWMNGSQIDDLSGTGFNGCYAQQVGDTYNDANQMAGEPTNHEQITNSEVRRADTESWYTATNWSPFTGEGTWYNKQVQSNSAIDIWDTCTS